MRPTPNATKQCLKCGCETKQELVPSSAGSDWKCTVCGNQLFAFSFADMVKLVNEQIFKTPKNPVPVSIPEGFKVFLKVEFPDYVTNEKEMEASKDCVEIHVKLTGQLPRVGKPLFANRDGVPVPYGEVLRVEGV